MPERSRTRPSTSTSKKLNRLRSRLIRMCLFIDWWRQQQGCSNPGKWTLEAIAAHDGMKECSISHISNGIFDRAIQILNTVVLALEKQGLAALIGILLPAGL